jgi:hypothetical protein
MKYSMRLKLYVCKSPYPYYIIHADEWLTKFEVWSNIKLFNAWLYTEEEVIAMIEAKYPGAERIERAHRSRPTQAARRNPYPAKQSLTPGPKSPQKPACVVENVRFCPSPRQI